MKTIEEILTLYFRAWNEPSSTAALVAESCAEAVRYVDPRYTCLSAGELAGRIERSRSEAASFHVRFTSAVDGYGDTFRYTWEFAVPDLKLHIPGWDVITRAEDGRIATLTSFFGALAPLEPGASLHVQPRWGV
jgi:hypothetical protein